MTTTDRTLASLLATPERDADAAFVAQVEALVRYDQRRAAARRSAFKRIGIETAAAGAMLTAFAAAARIGAPSDLVPLFSPAMAGLVALGVWAMVSLRVPARRSQAFG